MFEKSMVGGFMGVVLVSAMLGGMATGQVVLSQYEQTPGNEYQILFVTSGSIAATSTNIADYNSFVTQQADLNPTLAALGATWNAIASTPSTNAIDNCPMSNSVPIYGTNGQIVVEYGGTFWGEATPIQYDQNGDFVPNTEVWTGTSVNESYPGTGMLPLGEQIPFSMDPVVWEGPTMGATWWGGGTGIEYSEGVWFYGDGPNNILQTQLPMYALSSPITVPVPEPTTLTLSGSALLGIGLACLWRLRARA